LGLSLPTFEVVGVTDIREEAGRAKAEELDAPFFPDHQSMLKEMKPDVTVVMTPHPFHAPISIDALDAGSHVLVEKPIAVEVAEADAMIEAADRKRRLLAVNFQQRHRPEIKAAHRLIETGQLGDLVRVEMVEPWMRPAAYYRSAGWRGTWRDEGGGVLLNQAPHGLDLLCHLAGLPKTVFAWTKTLRHAIETEDTVLAMVEYGNGAVGTIYFSTTEAGPRRMELVGTKGRLRIAEDGTIEFTRFYPDLLEHIATNPGMYDAPDMEVVEVELGEGGGNHRDVYRDLHEAIVCGTPLMADARQARMSLELANAMILSGHTLLPVQLPLDREAYSELLAELRAGSK
jgi:UDP-N-acetyl-2-amino-2-deoxyglucuronate dehydrogenase